MGSFSIWHWLTVLLVLILLIWPFWYSARFTVRKYGRLQGFGGCLLWVAITIWLLPLRTLSNLGKDLHDLDALHLSMSVIAGIVVMYLGMIALQITTIVFMTRRSWRFIPSFNYLAISSVLFIPVFLLWTSTVVAIESTASFGTVLSMMIAGMTTQDWSGWISSMIGAAIWMLYVARSRRVANTFTRGFQVVTVAA